MKHDRRIELALVGLIILGAIAPFWLTPAVPTNDGPAHLYTAWLLGHWGDPAMDAPRHFRLFAFVPNWGSSGPLVPLLFLFSPETAEKVFFTILTALLVCSTGSLSNRLGGDFVIATGLTALLAHGWLLAMGFTGFLFALGAGLACCLLGLRAIDALPGARPALSTPRTLAFGVGAAVVAAGLFLLHLAGAAFAGAVWLLLCFARRKELFCERRRLVLAATPLLTLAVLCVVHSIGTHARVVPAFRLDSRTALDRALELPNGAYWEAYSSADRPYGQAVFACIVLLSFARAAGRGASGSASRWLALGGAGAFVAYLFAPWAGAGGAFITDRLLLLTALLVLPWTSGPGLPVRTFFRTAVITLALFGLAHRASQYRAWGRALGPVLSANTGIEAGSVLVQPPLVPLELAVDPRAHIWGRVATRGRLVSLDHYEAALVGWFPVGYSEETAELSRAWTSLRQAPPGAVAVRFP